MINTATDTVAVTIGGIAHPFDVAITPSGDFAYVTGTNFSSGTVTVIDTASNAVTSTVGVGFDPGGIAITPNGAFAYAADLGDADAGFPPRVYVINIANNTVVGTVTGSLPNKVAITPNGAFAYVSNLNATVSVIDTSNNTVVATVSVGTDPSRLAIDPAGTSVYVPNLNSGTVSVISTANNTVVATIGAGARPSAVAFAVTTHGPTNKDQCKNDGWQTFTNPAFKNQGQCIKFVNHMDEHQH